MTSLSLENVAPKISVIYLQKSPIIDNYQGKFWCTYYLILDEANNLLGAGAERGYLILVPVFQGGAGQNYWGGHGPPGPPSTALPGDPTKGVTRIWGHFVILVGCERVILRPQIMLTPQDCIFFWIYPIVLTAIIQSFPVTNNDTTNKFFQ